MLLVTYVLQAVFGYNFRLFLARLMEWESMRVVCPSCGSKAVISSSSKLSEQVTDLYCRCSNVAECGCTFVSTLAFKHTLNPPIKSTADLALSLINRLSKEERAALQQGVS